jgi:LPXTG-motif cell wall-anchored protein
MPTQVPEPQHPALPPNPALIPDADWAPPQALPETGDTPAPLITAAGITLLALGVVWPSLIAGVLGLLLLLAGVLLWLRSGLSSWQTWLNDHPEEQ